MVKIYQEWMAYVSKIRALMTIAKFMYGRALYGLGPAGVWKLHDKMVKNKQNTL